MSSEPCKFSFDEKKKLAEKISKLTSKNDLNKVKQIIEDNNPDLVFAKNKSGYLTKFQSLTPETYVKLTKHINSVEKRQMKELESEVLKSEIVSEELKIISSEKLNKKLRLTNTESHILNRAKYENELKKNEMESKGENTQMNDTDDIFIQHSHKARSKKPKK